MIEKDKMSREEIIAYYRPQIEKLIPYIPWLETQAGRQLSNFYGGDGLAENSISVPVYDSTLLGFVKAARATTLMDRNYVYVYSRNRIRTVEDECRFIKKAELTDMDSLCGIHFKRDDKGNGLDRRREKWYIFGVVTQDERTHYILGQADGTIKE